VIGNLGLNLMLALSRPRRAAGSGHALAVPLSAARGPLVWLHAPTRRGGRAAAALACRLHALRPTLAVLLTHAPDVPIRAGALPPGAMVHPMPEVARATLRQMVAHWQPGVAVQLGGTPWPGFWAAAARGGVPLFWLNARDVRLGGFWRLWPGLWRHLLSLPQTIMVVDDVAERILRRAGAPAGSCRVTGPMAEGHTALPHTEAEREAISALLGSRPIWLAAGLPMEELAPILAAHRAARRASHRLLLIIVPTDPADGPAMADAAQAEGLRPCRRGAEEEPGDEDLVYVADTDGELGLWYRLAAISFMGGSLAAPSGSTRDPMEAAALGSAVVHGPMRGVWADAFDSLAQARATRLVRGTDGLADAVSDLLAPDRCAIMARNAWAVATEGAEATEAAVDILLAGLDAMPVRQRKQG
jgi:3-deoxy-D-manno-octulosonic-acid transferase